MNSKEYKKFLEAYGEIYEQVRVPSSSSDTEALKGLIPKGEKVHEVPKKKPTLQNASYEPEGELVDEQETTRGLRLIDPYDKEPYSDDRKSAPGYKGVRKLPKMTGVIKAAEEYAVYDEVLEYLVNGGYTEEESNQIMVDFVTEGGIVKGLSALAKFVQKRASTPLKTAATDVATTALSLGGTPTGAKLSTTAAKVASPTPVVRTVKAPTARTAPKGANIAPDPWKQSSAPRTAKPSASSVKTPSTPKALTGSPTPKALTGTQARPALPTGKRGGSLAKTTPGGSLVSTRGAKPTFKPEALPKPKATTEPGGSLVSTRGAKPTFKPEALPKPKATTEPGGALVSTRAPKGAKPTFKPEALPKPKATTEPGGKLTTTKTPKSGLSPQGQEIERLNKMTGGGTLGSRELPKSPHRAPKPAWGSGETAPKPAPTSTTSKALPKPTSSVKPSVKVKPSSGGAGATAGATARGLKSIVKTGLGAGVAGVAADMAFPEPTASGTRDTAPKIPTTAKEVKKGETYYDPSTRVGSSQRFAQRKKVGPKIVGPGKVGTEAQSFDKAYGSAKAKGGMGSTFKWKGKDYKVS